MAPFAYYDDRPANPDGPNIIMSVVTTLLKSVSLYCQIWYDGIEEPHIVSPIFYKIPARITEIEGRRYSRWTYTCNLPGLLPLPKHVSLSPGRCENSDIIIPIQVPEVPEQQIEFGSCIVNSYGHIDFGVTAEWFELMKLFGVSEFNICNSSMKPGMGNILRHYKDENLLQVWHWPPPVPSSGWLGSLLGDIEGLTDCMLRNMYKYKYIIITDFDEFIVPRMHKNYSSMLQYINHQYHLTEPFKSYSFRNVYYFQDDKVDESQPKYLTTMKLQRRLNPSGYLFKQKSIINPLHCISVFSHYCKVDFPNSEGFTIDVPTDIAMSHHYRKCSYEPEECDYFLKMSFKDDFMLRFKSQIVGSVEQVLQKAGYFH